MTKGGKFQKRKSFNYPESFLYCLCSRKVLHLFLVLTSGDEYDKVLELENVLVVNYTPRNLMVSSRSKKVVLSNAIVHLISSPLKIYFDDIISEEKLEISYLTFPPFVCSCSPNLKEQGRNFSHFTEPLFCQQNTNG